MNLKREQTPRAGGFKYNHQPVVTAPDYPLMMNNGAAA